MTDTPDPTLELYKLYLETAEKVSDRRAAANTWMLSVNSAIVALYGYLGEKSAVGASEKGVWLWAIPMAGILVCLAWAALLASYSKLNSAKFMVLHEIEKNLPVAAFAREREIYEVAGRRQLSWVEKFIPYSFAGLYAVLLLASVVQVVG